jgi:hypothetical protein
MSETDERSGLLGETYRSVGPRFRARGDGEMNAIGWSIFLGMAILFVPLLPFIVVVWVLTRVIDLLSDRARDDKSA